VLIGFVSYPNGGRGGPVSWWALLGVIVALAAYVVISRIRSRRQRPPGRQGSAGSMPPPTTRPGPPGWLWDARSGRWRAPTSRRFREPR
jgi:hypothetical protein